MKFIISTLLVCILTSLHLSAQIRINEVCASNSESLYDEDADTPDWIEIYNHGNEPVNLKYWRISDKNDVENAWQFPDSTIQPREYAIVFASKKNRYSSGKYAMHTKGYNAIVSHNNRDGFRFRYKKIVGDFEAEVSIRSMQNEGLWGNAGLQVRETLSDTTKFISILAMSKLKDDFSILYREKVLESPSFRPIYGSPNLPYTKVWMKRENDSIYVAYKDRLDNLINTESFQNFLNDTLFFGASVSANNEKSFAKFILSDLKLNGITLSLDELSFYEINTNEKGYDYRYNEMHTDFTIKDDESLYLYKGSKLIDSVQLTIMTGDITNIYTEKDKWMITNDFTPGAKNGKGFKSRLPKPKIEFIDNKLLITDTTNATVRYTIDNSFPNENSKIYNSNESIFFDKTTTVKAISFKESYLPSFASTNLFFVNEPSTNFPIVSISADSSDLWGNYGIIRNLHGLANANFNYFSDYYTLKLDQNVEIKVHGNNSKNAPQKSLRLYADNKNESNYIDNKFFQKTNFNKYDQIVLRNSGTDWTETFLKDAFCSVVANSIEKVIAANYEPSLFFLNSKFWGIINIRERLDDDFIADYYKISDDYINYYEDNGVFVKGDFFKYDKYFNFIMERTFSKKTDYQVIDSLVEVQNFLNYGLLELYSANYDWPWKNIKIFQSDDIDDRFRYLVHDMDWTYNFAGFKADQNKIGKIINDQYSDYSNIMNKFLQNKQFKTEFMKRACDLVNSVFRSKNMIHVLDSLADRIRPFIPLQQQRWPESCVNWEERIVEWKLFLNERPDYFMKNINFHLNNEKGISEFTLTTYPPNGGTFKVNTITIDTSEWTGRYFQTIPVTITAIPKHGMKFVKWNHDSLGLESTITTTLPELMTIEAIYEEANVSERDKLIVINEIMYNADKDEDTKDWIELYNAGTKEVNLNGWSLIDEDITHEVFEINEDYLMQPDEYVILTKEKVEFEKYIIISNKVFGDFDFGLGGNDKVVLMDSDGTTHDSVNYDNDEPWPIAADGTGLTIELTNPTLDNNRAINWKTSQLNLGTPGKINSNYDSLITSIKISSIEKNIEYSFINNVLSVNSDVLINQIELSDISGKKILDYKINSKWARIDLSNIPFGVYLGSVVTEKNFKTIKLIINK